LRDGCQIGRHFYFAIHFLKYWRVELFLMEQLHFRLNFSQPSESKPIANTQSLVAFAYSMDTFWAIFSVWLKKTPSCN